MDNLDVAIEWLVAMAILWGGIAAYIRWDERRRLRHAQDWASRSRIR